jgi:hypothetical protein
LGAAGGFFRGAGADDDLNFAVAGVGGLGLPLDAIADHGYRFAIKGLHADIGIAVNLFHIFILWG